MISDGANIPAILARESGNKLDFRFSVARDYCPTIIKSLEGAYGKERVVRTGIKNHLSDTVTVHPRKLIIMPEEQDDTEIPFTKVILDDGSEILATEQDGHDISLTKISLYTLPELDLLHMLEQHIKTDPAEISMNDNDILKLFLAGDLSFLPGTESKGEANLLYKHLIETVKPKNFSELVSIISMMMGSNVWKNNGELLVEEGRKITELITCSDDVYHKLIGKGISTDQSYSIMESVRKGFGLTEAMEHTMKEAKVPDWYINSCKRIKYLVSRSFVFEHMIIYFRLAWYKQHYPVEYQLILAASEMLLDEQNNSY